MSKAYLSTIPLLPSSLSSLAPDVTFSYVGTTPSVPLTTHTSLQLTHTLTSPLRRPRELRHRRRPRPAPKCDFLHGGEEVVGGAGEGGGDGRAV